MFDIPLLIHFFIKEHPLKISDKRAHIPLLINDGSLFVAKMYFCIQ